MDAISVCKENGYTLDKTSAKTPVHGRGGVVEKNTSYCVTF
jgi:hypothetical protein